MLILIFVLFSSDLSMILCDPFSIHTIASSSIKVMQQLLSSEKLPRVRVTAQLPFHVWNL